MATDYFLKIDGIPGETTDASHKDEIQVLSFSWGASQSGTGAASAGGSGAGKVNMSDFSFNQYVNKASPKLMLACALGTHIASATLTCRRAGEKQQEYLVVKFGEVLISSYQTGGSGGDDRPSESISFNFTKVDIVYKPQNADGSLGGAVPAGYDLKKQEKS